jgi:hypothetical protein
MANLDEHTEQGIRSQPLSNLRQVRFAGSCAWIDRAIIATKGSLSNAAANRFSLIEKDCIQVRAGGLVSQVTWCGFFTESRARSDRLARLPEALPSPSNRPQ